MNESSLMEKIVSLAKRRGFVFPGSEIYGGLAGTYDYGPMGVLLNNNIKNFWWKKFVEERDDVYAVDASILMHPRVWEASGHTKGFSDPLVEDKVTHKRYRADHLLEDAGVIAHGLSIIDMGEKIRDLKLKSPEGNELTEPKVFNLLVEAGIGAVEGQKESVFLRGEITQGVHVNFKNVLDSMHPKLPFGIAQIGKAFRNEIVPGNFLFRVREFEQMELQYYIKPDSMGGKQHYEYWKQFSMDWYEGLGIRSENLRFRQHEEHERAHYAQDAWDIEFNSPIGWKEAWGIHHRGDWDLRRHQEYSGISLQYLDPNTNERFTPSIIETSGGVGRAFLFVLLDAYREDSLGGETRVYLALSPKIAPVKAMVSPLLKNKPELVARAHEVRALLKKVHSAIAWDDNGNIGKRYRRQDEIGTPFCITVDFDTLGERPELKDTVTLRQRDTGAQERLTVSDVAKRIHLAIQ